MKRTFLSGLGLDDDIISKIMEENGRDIEREKAVAKSLDEDSKNLKLELSETKRDLQEALKSDTSDVDGLKKSIEEWKTKAESAKKEADERVAAVEYDTALKDGIAGVKFSSTAAKKAILDDLKAKGLKHESGKILGLEDAIKELRESDKGAFVIDEQAHTDTPTVTLPNGTKLFQPDGTKPASSYSIDEIKKMTPEQINKNWDSVKNTLQKGT